MAFGLLGISAFYVVCHYSCPEMVLHPAIKDKKLDVVYLDTTYLNPQVCLPTLLGRALTSRCSTVFPRSLLSLLHAPTWPGEPFSASDLRMVPTSRWRMERNPMSNRI